LVLVLHLAEIAPRRSEHPRGVEIVTWAERPELARGMYEFALEALPDIPARKTTTSEPFDDWLAHDMQGSATVPKPRSSPSPARRSSLGEVLADGGAADDSAPHLSAVKASLRGRGIAGALKAAADQLGAHQRLQGGCTPATSSGTSRSGPERSARLPAGIAESISSGRSPARELRAAPAASRCLE